MTEWPEPGVGGTGGADDAPEAPDPRSFAERFAGTPWGSAADAGAPDPAHPTVVVRVDDAPRRSHRMAWAGVGLLGGSLAIGLLLVLASSGAFGAPTPTPVPLRVTPGPVDPEEAAAAIDRFAAFLAAKPTYEARMKGTTDRPDGHWKDGMTARVAGADVDVRYRTVDPSGKAQEVRVIVVGDQAWVQPAGSAKARKADAPPAGMPDALVFRGLTAADQLWYVGKEQRRGLATDHLRTVRAWTSPLGGRLVRDHADARVELSVLDIWVLPDGRPIEVVHGFRARFTALFYEGLITAEASYVLSRVGEKVVVSPPR